VGGLSIDWGYLHLHPLQRGEGGEDILQDQAGQPLDHGNIGSHNDAKILATVPPRVPEGRNRPMTTVPDVCSPMATGLRGAACAGGGKSHVIFLYSLSIERMGRYASWRHLPTDRDWR
jgi:hypothetical protein